MAKKVSKVTKVSGKQQVSNWEAMQGFLFWKQAQGLSKTTINDYKKHITLFFKRFPDCWRDDNIKYSILEYMSDEIKPATVNLRLVNLKGFFEWCVAEGELAENPLKGLKKRKTESRT